MLGVKDIVAGSIGGIGQCVSGHPLDTIKVRLQTSDKYKGTLDCFQTTVKEEGFAGLYRGIQSPLVGMAAMNSVLFLSYGQTKNLMKKDEHDPLSIKQIFAAGLLVGVAVSFVECPVDLFKSQLQTSTKYTGFLDCASKIWKNHGVRGVYQGLGATFLRDIPANAAYFGFYEMARRGMVETGKTVNDLPAWKVLMAGGFGGMMYWITTFPFDVIKSKIQTDSTEVSQRKFKGISDAASKIYKAEGFGGFWKGIAPCMIRSFPANAVCFLLYEQTKKFM